jgi:hypothetical protein
VRRKGRWEGKEGEMEWKGKWEGKERKVGRK